jgi:hypothetical protein
MILADKLVQFQLSVSTADEERIYFTGYQRGAFEIYPDAPMLPGNYRIVDGKAYRIIDAAAPLDEHP